jgi:hypothetical protein
MARKKQQKKRLKKYQGKYVTADRLDMSKGGRVQAQVGGMQRRGEQEGRARNGDMSIGGPGGGRGGPGTGMSEDEREAKRKEAEERRRQQEEERRRKEEEERRRKERENKALAATPQMTGATSASQQRTGRIAQTAEQVQAGAEGKVPEAAVIPEAEKVGGIDPKTGLPIGKQKTTTMAEPTAVSATTAKQVTEEGVTTGAVKTAQTPQDIETAQMVAAQVSTSPDVQAAIGELSPEAVAKVQEISELSGPAEAARISESIANVE